MRWESYLAKIARVRIQIFLVILTVGTPVTSTLAIQFVSGVRTKNFSRRFLDRVLSFHERILDSIRILDQLLFQLTDKVLKLHLVSTHKLSIITLLQFAQSSQIFVDLVKLLLSFNLGHQLVNLLLIWSVVHFCLPYFLLLCSFFIFVGTVFPLVTGLVKFKLHFPQIPLIFNQVLRICLLLANIVDVVLSIGGKK